MEHTAPSEAHQSVAYRDYIILLQLYYIQRKTKETNYNTHEKL